MAFYISEEIMQQMYSPKNVKNTLADDKNFFSKEFLQTIFQLFQAVSYLPEICDKKSN